jgi:hypothetical protein
MRILWDMGVRLSLVPALFPATAQRAEPLSTLCCAVGSEAIAWNRMWQMSGRSPVIRQGDFSIVLPVSD